MILRDRRRAAFTLIELLVVISIIVLLLGLTMSGVSAVRQRQMVRATDDIVTKLQVGIDDQVKALVDEARKCRRERTAEFTNLIPYCGGDEDRAEGLLAEIKVRHAFPQTFAEAQANTPIINSTRHTAYASLPATAAASAPDQESAVLLYLAMRGLGTSGIKFATDEATTSSQIDLVVGNYTGRVFKDSWGNPVGFKRFMQSTELDLAPYANVKTGFLDPFDTQGKLAGVWTNRAAAETAMGVPFNNSNKVVTAYSAGKDGDFSTLGDNVYGFRLRKLGEKSK